MIESSHDISRNNESISNCGNNKLIEVMNENVNEEVIEEMNEKVIEEMNEKVIEEMNEQIIEGENEQVNDELGTKVKDKQSHLNFSCKKCNDIGRSWETGRKLLLGIVNEEKNEGCLCKTKDGCCDKKVNEIKKN